MDKKQTHLIIGKGEIGTALSKVLSDYSPICLDFHIDLRIIAGEYVIKNPNIDIMHICFEYSNKFIKSVKNYQKIFKPKYTIIHSSVPVGISRKCNAMHSPIIGQHPYLEIAIKIFPKMLAGDKVSEVADEFRRAGLRVILFDKPETTEAGKLFLTEYYRICIEFVKRVKRYCDYYNLNFSEVYRIPNMIYNAGYEKLGYKEFVRPILEPIMTNISGHCVMANKKKIKLNEKCVK